MHCEEMTFGTRTWEHRNGWLLIAQRSTLNYSTHLACKEVTMLSGFEGSWKLFEPPWWKLRMILELWVDSRIFGKFLVFALDG